jgi:hypothetical protein
MKTILAVLLMAILAAGASALELSAGGGLSVGAFCRRSFSDCSGAVIAAWAVCGHGAREAHFGNCAAYFLETGSSWATVPT